MKTMVLTAVLACAACCSEAQKVQTVDSVDLKRYLGHWYEIAAYPKWFERGMTHVTAQYTLDGDKIRVTNSGIRNGKRKDAHAKAWPVKGSGNAKLKVQFFWPFKSDYWIIDLAPDYSWAVVSDPKRSSLWILSRTKVMPEQIYSDICRRLAANGFDLEELKRTPQD